MLKNTLSKLSLLSFAVALAACSSSDSNDGNSPYPPAEATFSNFQSASVVIGQADFTATSTPVTSASSTKGGIGSIAYLVDPEVTPSNENTVTKQLLLAASTENRVLIYNDIPIVNMASAESVLGQPNLSSANLNTTKKGMRSPAGVAIGVESDKKIILVSDRENHRILGFNQHLPLVAGTKDIDADKVIGQMDFATSSSTCSAAKFNQPSGMATTSDGKLLVADSKHHRVLIFNKIPSIIQGETNADAALGVANLSTCPNSTTGSGSTGFKNPTAIWTNGTQLIVADTGHHRLLVWNNFDFTLSSFPPADFAIGQENLINIAANQGSGLGAQTTPSAATLNLESPNITDNITAFDVSSTGELCVPDTANNRVLLWNKIPAKSGVAADIVLGQNSFDRWVQWDEDQDGRPDGQASAKTLFNPVACKFIDNKLIVADYGTNRYLVFEKR